MRKRGKKRVPQDIKPWLGVRDVQADVLELPAKKTSRWVAGGRRDWNTRVLLYSAAAEISGVLHRSISQSLPLNKTLAVQQGSARRLGVSKLTSLGKYKNFCLYSGRGRTYNRSLYIARHNLRRLVSVGLVSGLVK